jgi:hypothetical protein
LLNPVELLLRALACARLIRDSLQLRRAHQLRERKSSLRFIETELLFQFAERHQQPSARFSNRAFRAALTKRYRSAAISARFCRYMSIFR